MFRILAALLLIATVAFGGEDPPQTTPEEATRTEVGQAAPLFQLETVGGETFDLQAQRGKVVLVNFWATWCPPCIEELPALRDRVFDRFAGEGFAMLCVSREESNEKIAGFARKREVEELPMAGDLDRSVYSLYAEHTIPRNVVIDRDGRIVFQSFGFEEEEFERMIQVIEEQIAIKAVGVPLGTVAPQPD
jgi:peroxiredoxin